MKYLVKFCNSKYNIEKNCKTLNFGTLDYYSTIEGSRRDLDEGKIEEGLPPGTVINMKPGDKPIRLDFLGGEVSGGTIAVGPNGNLSSIYSFNCYVFCMSYLEKKDVNVAYGQKLFGEDVDSFYAIPENRIKSFVDYLTVVLDSNLKKNDFLEELNPTLNDDWGKQFALRCMFRPVEYYDKKYIDLRERIDPKQIINKLVFNKSSAYSNEKEFRIAFIPYLEQNYIICNNKNKLVNIYPNVFEAI